MSADGLTPEYAEQLLIGQLLLHPEKYQELEITPEYLISARHRKILEVIAELHLQGAPIDAVSVSECLEKVDTWGWLAYLGHCANESFTGTFFKTSQKFIKSNFQHREIKRISKELSEGLDHNKAIRELMDLNIHARKHLYTLPEATFEALEKAEYASKNNGLNGLTTGLTALDSATGGFQQPDLIVIGARPSVGKTAVALNLMMAPDCPVAFFSTEQPHEQIGARALSMDSMVSAHKIRTAKIDQHDQNRMAASAVKISKSKVLIYDKSAITIDELMQQARKMKYHNSIEAIYVDYLQRIRAHGENRRIEVANVAIGLKSLARELEVPVIVLAQVNRSVDERSDKRPRMGDLLESGVIEQEADSVILLYRDSVYNRDSKDSGIIEFLIDKNRHGPTGVLRFAWIADSMKVENLAGEYR